MTSTKRHEKAPIRYRGFCVFQKSLLALGAISIHRSGLETAFFEPLHDPVFREAEVRFHPQIRYASLLDVPINRLHVNPSERFEFLCREYLR